MRKKIALIGGGQIGQILAMLAAQKELGDIVILDIPELENPAKGKALDLMEMAPHGNYDAASPARPTTRTSPAPTSSSSPPASPARPA